MHCMEKYCLFFLIGLISCTVVFAQPLKIQAIYKAQIYKSENAQITPSKRTELIMGEVENLDLQFLYCDGKASFQSTNHAGIVYRTSSFRNAAEIILDVKDAYYADLGEKKIITTRKIGGMHYTIEYGFNHFSWVLTTETKTINGYLCYKATTAYSYTNRSGTTTTLEVTAWYTPEIPLPMGPKNYAGLPGFIVELQEGPKRIYLTQIKLNSEEIFTIEKPYAGKRVTEPEFERIAAEAYNDFKDVMKRQ